MGYAPMWLRRLRSLNLGPVLRHRSRFADFAELAACKTLGMGRVRLESAGSELDICAISAGAVSHAIASLPRSIRRARSSPPVRPETL